MFDSYNFTFARGELVEFDKHGREVSGVPRERDGSRRARGAAHGGGAAGKLHSHRRRRVLGGIGLEHPCAFIHWLARGAFIECVVTPRRVPQLPAAGNGGEAQGARGGARRGGGGDDY